MSLHLTASEQAQWQDLTSTKAGRDRIVAEMRDAWRGPRMKGKHGVSSNLTKSIRGRHDYFNFHITHGRWWF